LHVRRASIGLIEASPLIHVGAQSAPAGLAGQFDNDRRGNQRLIRVAFLRWDDRERREVAPRRPVVGLRRVTDRRNAVGIAGRDISQKATDRCHGLCIASAMPELKTELTLFQAQNRPFLARSGPSVKICVTVWDS